MKTTKNLYEDINNVIDEGIFSRSRSSKAPKNRGYKPGTDIDAARTKSEIAKRDLYQVAVDIGDLASYVAQVNIPDAEMKRYGGDGDFSPAEKKLFDKEDKKTAQALRQLKHDLENIIKTLSKTGLKTPQG